MPRASHFVALNVSFGQRSFLMGAGISESKEVALDVEQGDFLAFDEQKNKYVLKRDYATPYTGKCATCHRIGDVGREVGPNLTALTDKSPAALLTALLDPNQAVETRYVSYLAETTNGRLLNGILTSEGIDSSTVASRLMFLRARHLSDRARTNIRGTRPEPLLFGCDKLSVDCTPRKALRRRTVGLSGSMLGHPGGMPAISRGLSESDTPGLSSK